MSTNGTPTETTAPVEGEAREQGELAVRMADYERNWNAFRQRQTELLPANKAALFDALATAGVERVAVAFDGSGDSGQLESAVAFDAGGDAVALPTAAVAFSEPVFGAPETITEAILVPEAIERLAYSCLEQTHEGWENNDGGYGEFRFDVAERVITLEFNERYTETTCHEHAF